MNARKLTTLAGAAAAVALAMPQVAAAGGLARPNPISARSIGMGGAFAAIADDPTALHFNPAGLANLQKNNLLLGIELAYAPRTYTPLDTDGNYGDPESPEAPFFPLPVIGYASRLKSEGVPSRLAFGIGTWVSHGGSLSYPKFEDPLKPALNETMNAVVEIVPGIAYEVNDVLKLGVALRLGFGLFAVNSNKRPLDSDLSSNGFGVGATLGALVTPSERLSIGAFYRSNLTVTAKGEGTLVNNMGDVNDVNVEMKQRWPQAAGASVAFRPSSKLLVAVQLDWTGWQRSNDLIVRFPGDPSLLQEFDLDWEDNFAFHLGAEYAMSEKLALRAGGTFDTRAVSKRTQERQFSDSDKILTAVGASIQMTQKWRFDTSFELIIPRGATTIPNNDEDANMVGWTLRRNLGPGDHEGSLFTLELAAQYLF
jgi:long-chain fatty acid transport protein